MRTILRTGLSFVAGAGTLLLATSALGGDGGTDSGTPLQNCDPSTLWCSNGWTVQKAESKDPFLTGIDTGWMPRCDGSDADHTPNAKGHCAAYKIQVRALISLTPLKSGQPTYSVVMNKAGTVMDARWPDDQVIQLSLAKLGKASPTDGTFTVTHSLMPSFEIYVNAGSIYEGEIKIDATTLINLIPGAQFDYAATGSTKFNPWGFDKVELQVKGKDFNNSKLFDVTFDTIAGAIGVDIKDYVTGSFSFNATTDSTFVYQTNKVLVSGASKPIAFKDDVTTIPTVDEDYIVPLVHAEGTIRYTGTIEVLPVIHITSVMGIGITMDFPISVGLKFPYDSGAMPVVHATPTDTPHIPLPNVSVDTTTVNFGTLQTGQSAEKKIPVHNYGEMGGLVVEVKCDDNLNQFKPKGLPLNIDPNGAVKDLTMVFKATKGQNKTTTATCTAKTNDPNEPMQTFQVKGTGQGEDITPDPPDDGGAPLDDGGSAGGSAPFSNYNPDSGQSGGCGCRTSTAASGLAWGGLALLGVGLARARRRRR
jgi:MYXO-CTERM domain-containing protein